MEEPANHLQKIETELLARGLEAEYSTPTDPIPFNHLLLTLLSDTNETEYFTLIVSMIEAEILAANFDSGGQSDLIQMLHPFPYEIVPEKIQELSRFIHLLNKVLVLGAFGFDEKENRCFYRYAYSLSRSHPDYSEVANVVLLVQDVLNTYAGTLEDISTGVASIDEMLALFQPAPEEENEGG